MPKPPRPPLLGGKTTTKNTPEECVMRPKISSGRRARPSRWSAETLDMTPQATAAVAAAAAPRRLRRRRPSDLLRASTVATLAFLCTGGGGGGVRLVSAVCPNRCSGHGECGLENVCECEADWGIVADCSLKQCPTGMSWGSKVCDPAAVLLHSYDSRISHSRRSGDTYMHPYDQFCSEM